MSYEKQLAKEHVAWFMGLVNEVLPPLLETHMVHGYKHGFEDGARRRK